MAEENQVMKEPQGEAVQAQQVTEEQQLVTTNNPKKVEVGKRLAAHNCKKTQEQRKSKPNWRKAE